jgi:beta-1,4-mannosyltransferase
VTAGPLPRVLSYPPRHPYVDRLEGRAATLVHRDQPWPRLPDLYDPDWVSVHADGWDLAHWHFTWEQYPEEQVDAVLEAHARAGVPIVWTAHDLDNPHTGERSADDRYLRLLARSAGAVTTLTHGAAEAVHDRFGRRAEVIGHGPLVDLDAAALLRRQARPDGPLRVLLHAKSLRANVDVRGAIEAAARARADGADLELTVSLHDEPATRAALDAPDRRGVELDWHTPWDHDELCRRVAAADVLLLPYRWGTHSGLAELACDVGTATVATTVGWLHQQVPVVRVRGDRDGVDVDGLAAALADLAATGPPPSVPLADRRAALDRFVTLHRSCYASLLA